ncbi:MAG: hypothetical protein AAFX02_11190 [Pseudomonadota bacterium]
MAQPAPKFQPAPTAIWSPKKAEIVVGGKDAIANDNSQRQDILSKRRRRQTRLSARH